MLCKRIIVVTIYHLRADNLWEIWELSALEHSLDVLPVLRKAYSSECFCFLIFVLKFGQSQSHASDIGNIKTVSSDHTLERVSELVELEQNSRSAYQNLVEKRQVTQIDQKARYSGQQRLQAVQDLVVLGAEDLFLFYTSLRVSRQGIDSSASFALIIVNSKVVTREFLGPADFSGAQTLYVYKPTEVVIVGEYEQLMLEAF